MKINPSAWRLFFEEGEQVLAIPSWNMPRVYLPSRSICQRWSDAGAFYPALRFRSKMVRFVFRILVSFFPQLFMRKSTAGTQKPSAFHRVLVKIVPRIKLLRHSALFQSLVPDAYGLSIKLSCESSDFSFSLEPWIEVLPEFDHAVVMVGAAADEKQKLIVRMEDRQQRVLAFLKYAEQPIARQKIENEKQVLSALARGLGPEALGFDRCGDGKALLMTAVLGKPLSARMPGPCGSRGMEGIQRFLKRLETSAMANVDEHPAIVCLRKQVTEVGGQRSEDCCQSSVIGRQDFEEILAPLRVQKWPITIQHGDLTPWNIIQRTEAGGQRSAELETENLEPALCAIDWEDGSIEGFPGFDLVYLCIQTGYFLHHWTLEKVMAVAVDALPGPSSSEECHAIVRLGALDSFFRGRADGMPDAHPLQKFRLEIVRLGARD